MNKLGTALLSASALLVAGTAAAELPEWTYGQVGYYQADSVGSSQTDGFTVDASVGLFEVWHLQAGYIDGSLGDGGFDNDFDGWSVTAGAHPAINEKSQLVINVGYFDTSYDESSGGSIDRDGYGVGVGVRTNVTDKVEASAVAWWSDASFDEDISSSDSDVTTISVVLGGRYNWTKNFSTGATVVIGDPVIVSSGDNSMNLDVRYTFAGLRL
jgi:hypothetical protein